MSYKTLYICIACSLVSGYSKADELSDVKMPSTMQNARLFHSENGFTVVQDGNEKDIQPCFVSPELRKISPELLGKFIAADNYLKLSELKRTDGSVDYKLNASNRLRGGGPVAGFIGYWGTKTICYGTMLAAAGGAEGAAIATAAAVSAGGVAAVVTGIETASAGVGGFLLCCPFLP